MPIDVRYDELLAGIIETAERARRRLGSEDAEAFFDDLADLRSLLLALGGLGHD